jgi:hypothetical protein
VNNCGCWLASNKRTIDVLILPFRRIFHPTDFSAADSAAFAHAVKLTILAQGKLTMMHVDPTIERKNFEDFPRIRPLLARWGILLEGSSKEMSRNWASRSTASAPSQTIQLAPSSNN